MHFWHTISILRGIGAFLIIAFYVYTFYIFKLGNLLFWLLDIIIICIFIYLFKYNLCLIDKTLFWSFVHGNHIDQLFIQSMHIFGVFLFKKHFFLKTLHVKDQNKHSILDKNTSKFLRIFLPFTSFRLYIISIWSLSVRRNLFQK